MSEYGGCCWLGGVRSHQNEFSWITGNRLHIKVLNLHTVFCVTSRTFWWYFYAMWAFNPLLVGASAPHGRSPSIVIRYVPTVLVRQVQTPTPSRPRKNVSAYETVPPAPLMYFNLYQGTLVNIIKQCNDDIMFHDNSHTF